MTERFDNFNREDGVLGSPSDGGSPWVVFDSSWEVASNRAKLSGGNGGAVLESATSVVSVQSTVLTAGSNVGLIGRYVDPSNYLLLNINVADSVLQIFKRASGSYGLLLAASVTYPGSSVVKFTLDAANVLTGYVNDVPKLSITEAAFASATKHGMWSYGDIGTPFDDFSITTIAADTTPPNITSSGTGSTNGPFAANCAENSTGVCITLTSSEALSTVVMAGADAALFTLGGSGLTRTLQPSAAFNFEGLPHANPFIVSLDFVDDSPALNTRTVTVNITVTNVNEPPGPPTIGTATPAASGSVSVAFTAPSMTGKPSITGYTVTASPGGATGTGLSSPITVSGLTNGTAYTFTVTATNSEGTSSPSAASNSATPVLAPPGVFTSEILKRNNGTVAASVSLTYVRFYNPSSGALVLERTGISTNSSGVFTVTDAALAAGVNYAVDWVESGGQRRLPRKAAA